MKILNVVALNRMNLIVAIRQHIGHPSPYYLRALMDISIQVYLDDHGYHFVATANCRVAMPAVEIISITVQDAHATSQEEAERALISAMYEQLRTRFNRLHPHAP